MKDDALGNLPASTNEKFKDKFTLENSRLLD